MLFHSFFFILIFLPLSLLGWFGLNHFHKDRLAKVFLIGMSLWFYGAFGTEFLPVLLTSVFVNYGISLLSDSFSRSALRQVLATARQAGENGGRTWGDRDEERWNEEDWDEEEFEDETAERSQEAEQDAWAERTQHRIMQVQEHRQHVLMFFGILFNLLFLAVFKYGPSLWKELLPWLQQLPGGIGRDLPASWSLAYPVGISFYTFSQIAFVVDRCRGEIAHDGFLNYCLTTVFFPKLAEGPITSFREIAPQFQDRDRKFFRPDNFTRGIVLFIFGLAKKVLLADNLAPAADFGFTNAGYLDTLTVCATLMAYAFQLYFDFSGYMDMGAGIAWMFNIDLPENFASPYKAVSFSDFWQRWHMTLTRFFTKYVYIPLGGSRRGSFRTMCNVMIVFVLSAFWHGTGWTYLYWGVLSGVLVILCSSLYRRKAAGVRNRFGVTVLRIVTFAEFCFTLIFFRASSMEYALAMLKRLFVPVWPGFLFRMASQLDLPELYLVRKAVEAWRPAWSNALQLETLLALLTISVVVVNGRWNARELADAMADGSAAVLRRRRAVLLGILFAWCLVSLSGVTTFLYFKF